MGTMDGLDWLRLIAAPDALRNRMEVELVTVPTGEQTCCALRIDGQWLTSQSAAMIFASSAAAEKFVEMVGAGGVKAGPATQVEGGCRKPNQCYRLSKFGGLSPCPMKKQPHPYYAAEPQPSPYPI